MHILSEKVMKHKRAVLISFIALILLSAVLSRLVDVNYDLFSYLPEDSPSTTAVNVMNEDFVKTPPNARVFIPDVSIPQALDYKRQIASVEGILEVNWLDDAQNIYEPIETMPDKVLDSWYKDDNALLTLVIDKEKANSAINEIKSIIGEHGEITGEAVDKASVVEKTGAESGTMMLLILPIIIIILLLTTSSWFEPLLFLIAIGTAIIINNGTNVFLGEISFITKTTSSILQLAVSIDYSIFLLHRFSEFREKGLDVKTAMIQAMTHSFSSITASAMTTVIGFGALIIMRFKIGPDMGIVLAKGVFLSLLSVMLFLPVITVYMYKLIDKSRHRSLLPSFHSLGTLSKRLSIPVLIIVAVLVIPSFLAQNRNNFIYGASVMGDSQKGISQTETYYGKANTMVLLVPKGDIAKEKELCQLIFAKPYVKSIISYAETIGATVPSEFIPEDKLSNLQSDRYSRIILTLNMEEESEEAFQAVEEIRMLSSHYYGDTYYLTGGPANIYDMKETITQDNKIINLIAILGIGIVLLITFRSLTLPLILLITIEASIWINLAVPYFADEKMAYLGYLIISSIQLGATVDYAILFTNRYMENKRSQSGKMAAVQTISDTASSILTSSTILIISGAIMGFVSSNEVVRQLGVLISRGTLLSALMVFFFLPTALVLLEKIIEKTTYKAKNKGEEVL